MPQPLPPDVSHAPVFSPHTEPVIREKDLEIAWFDAPRRSSRPPKVIVQMPPPSPIDDPLADRWFR